MGSCAWLVSCVHVLSECVTLRLLQLVHRWALRRMVSLTGVSLSLASGSSGWWGNELMEARAGQQTEINVGRQVGHES